MKLKTMLLLIIMVLFFTACMPKSVSEESSEPINVTFWYPYGEGSWTGDFLGKKITEFNESNSDIVVTGQSFQDYSSIIEGIQRGAAGDNLPSIATIGFGFDDYIIESGLATPINTILNDSSGSFLDDFNSSLLEVTTVDDQVYGVPLALSIAEIFYHPDLLDKAGLDSQNPPKTWDEFIEATGVIQEKLGIYGAAFALDDPWIFETAVRSGGAEFISEDGLSANLNSEAAIKILSDWGEGAAKGSILYNTDFFETLQTFGAKEVAMFAVSSYGTVYYHDNQPEVKAMAFPVGEGNVFKSPAGGNSLYILGNNDAERSAAMQFVTFLLSPEANAEWAKNSGYLPTRESSIKAMADYIDGFDNYKLAIGAINNVVPPTQWPSRRALQINQIIMEAIEAAMLGQMGAEEALQHYNEKVNALLK